VTIPVNEIMKFVNEHSQLVLEIEGEATTEGTRAEQYTDIGGDHQRWRLKPAGPGNDDFYNIENVHSGMSLEVVGSSTDPGAEIVQRPYDNGPLHRQWKLVPIPGKTDVYKIENRNSGLVLDDVGGQTNAPAPVKQYGSWDDDGRQQWKLIRVATNASGQPATTQPARISSGQTSPGQGWRQHTDHGVGLDVDTSSAKFSGTPTYVISLSGPGGNMWLTTGGSSAVYEPTPKGFKVYLRRADGQPLPVKIVTDDYKWYVNWIGIEE
jgi:hypothetical protein